MDWLSMTPPMAALVVAVWTRNVYWALGLAIWLSETLMSGFNPALAALGGIDRAVSVLGSAGNTRILLFCLIIGALIAYMRRSGGVTAMVEALRRGGLASTPRRAGFATAFFSLLIFVETNISLLASGVLGRPLFDRLQMSRERLAYIIDSTSSPVCVLILLNGWGAYLLSLLTANGVEEPFQVLLQTIPLNFYALLTIAGVLVTIALNRTFGPLRAADSTPPAARHGSGVGVLDGDDAEPSRALYVGVPMAILVVGSIGFMLWTGEGDITKGSGSQSILWAVVLATAAAFVFLVMSGRDKGKGVTLGFQGMGDMLPAVTVIFLALVLGDSLRALGVGAFIAGIAEAIPAPWTIPAMLFLAACATSFTTGTSWGTYGILTPIAVPLAVGAGVPLPLAMAAVVGGGVFGDHCSPISDTTIIASAAAGCEHLDHVKTQLPYALMAGGAATVGYLLAGLLVVAA